MTSDMGQDWNDYREERKKKRARNREWSTKYLTDQGVMFKTNNQGMHLQIMDKDLNVVADFWPGTGKYRMRNSKTYKRGVKHMVGELRKRELI